LVLAILVGTTLLALNYYRSSEPQYSVSYTVLIVPSPQLVAVRAPDSPTGGVSANPFGATNGASVLANSLSSSLTNSRIQADILPLGTGLASIWDSEASTAVRLTTIGQSPQAAQGAMGDVSASLDRVLADIQVRAGAPSEQLYVASPIADPDFPVVTYPDRLRTVIATVLAGVVVAVVLAVLLDGILARRRSARHMAERPSKTGSDTMATPGASVSAEDPRA
jgi:hypothetical protein